MISREFFDALKLYCDFGARDVEVLREAYPRLREHFLSIVDDFYRRILSHDETRRILEGPAQIERLKGSLSAWLTEVFLGPHDASYLEKRSRIGQVHVRIGLSQAYVFAAMSHIQRRLEETILTEIRGPQEFALSTIGALTKVLHLDLALIAGAYHEAEKYHDLVEFAPDMIHQVDRRGRIVNVNQTELRRLGYSASELVGRYFQDLVFDEDREAFRDHMDRVFRNGESRCEVRLRTSSGEVLDAEILATAVRDVHTQEFVLSRAYVRDVTERKRMERTLVEQASLTRLGEMMAVVAHEVKNPIAGISGALQIIANQLPAASSGRSVLQEILDRLDALNNSVNDLLLYARPQIPRFTPVPVLSLIEDTVALLLQDPDLSALQVRTTGPEAIVRGDAELLKQAFLNILINAAQAMDGKGTVSIAVDVPDGSCSIRVTDTGPGIPAEIRKKIFEPFFSTKHRGTGLGLPITRRIIEAHGGTMEIASPRSGGTEIVLLLPLAGSGTRSPSP